MLLCHIALGGTQLLPPKGDTGRFTSFQTLGFCFINLQYFSVGTHIGSWLSWDTVALLQGQGGGLLDALLFQLGSCSPSLRLQVTAISCHTPSQGSGFPGL